MTDRLLSASVVGLIFAVTSTATRAAPVGPDFTYQGSLKDNGSPANGTFDLTFTLWDAAGSGNPPIGGSQIGGAVNKASSSVSNGLFTVRLNELGEFGPTAFDGNARWLQIAVNGTPLAPRQPLTAVPYALSAPGSGLWTAGAANISNANAGNVGIGTSTPAAKLHVEGNLRQNGRIALGNEGILGADILYERIFDFTHRITDFTTSASFWNPFHSEIFADPAADLTRSVIGYKLTTRTAPGNPRTVSFLGGCDVTAVHGGTGQLATLRGEAVFATAAGPVTQQTGLYIGSDGITGGVIGDNRALEISSGHRAAGGSITNDYSVYIQSPSRNSPLANHYGLYLAPQGNVANSFSIYADGGISYLKDPLGIGTSAPAYPLHVTSTGQRAIFGHNTATSGTNVGVFGKTDSPTGRGVQGECANGTGVYGVATATSGLSYGVYGTAAATSGFGVYGYVSAASGINYGVAGESESTSGQGVFGIANAATGPTNGVFGVSYSTTGKGTSGLAVASSGLNYGVYGSTNSTTGIGVYGIGNASSGVNYGVYGTTNSPSGFGVYGATAAGAQNCAGVYGKSISFNSDGVLGESTSGTGVAGVTTGSSAIGVYGENGGTSGVGVMGYNFATTGSTMGVSGVTNSTSGKAVQGLSWATSGICQGVHGISKSINGRGVQGTNDATSGVAYGVYGETESASGRAIYGQCNATSGTTYAVRGLNNNTAGYGVYSAGDLGCSGTKAFVIDHPADPENKYLKHYCAEGPEPLNIYTGSIRLDPGGHASVQLPDYFGDINRDPRIMLTAAGGPMPNLHASEDIVAGRFEISGGKPGGKVFWEVKAVRNDLWVRTHGAPVEIVKDATERGHYQHPDLFGQPAERGIDFMSRPETMPAAAPPKPRAAPASSASLDQP